MRAMSLVAFGICLLASPADAAIRGDLGEQRPGDRFVFAGPVQLAACDFDFWSFRAGPGVCAQMSFDITEFSNTGAGLCRIGLSGFAGAAGSGSAQIFSAPGRFTFAVPHLADTDLLGIGAGAAAVFTYRNFAVDFVSLPSARPLRSAIGGGLVPPPAHHPRHP